MFQQELEQSWGNTSLIPGASELPLPKSTLRGSVQPSFTPPWPVCTSANPQVWFDDFPIRHAPKYLHHAGLWLKDSETITANMPTFPKTIKALCFHTIFAKKTQTTNKHVVKGPMFNGTLPETNSWALENQCLLQMTSPFDSNLAYFQGLC